MIITGEHLPRRTFLRGAGITLALPLLEAMVPALRAQRLTAAAPVRRLGVVMYPMGVVDETWRPRKEGKHYELTESLAPLAKYREQFLVLSGLSADPDRSKAGFHDRAICSFLTGCEMTKGKIKVGISVDQIAANELGKQTQIASLETGTEELNGFGGISFKSETLQLPFEINPRNVFERLFGEGSKVDPAAAAERRETDRSRLDAVVERIASLKQRLGPADRRKLDEYVESVRDIERRIQVASRKPPAELPALARPAGIPDSWPEHVKMMLDLNVLALQADLTRVFTFMMAPESSYMSFPQIGITMQHHEISHHNFEAEKLAALTKINVHQHELFRHLLERMTAIKEADGTLLDRSLLLFGSTLSNPTTHSQDDLPIILAGGAAGRLAGGRHNRYDPKSTPLSNLFLTMLDKVGIPTEHIGDSTGRLNRLEV